MGMIKSPTRPGEASSLIPCIRGKKPKPKPADPLPTEFYGNTTGKRDNTNVDSTGHTDEQASAEEETPNSIDVKYGMYEIEEGSEGDISEFFPNN